MVNSKRIAELRVDPTKEEAELLELYRTLTGYEKQADDLRRQAALAKQREADERFRREQQSLQNNKVKSRKRKKLKDIYEGSSDYNEGEVEDEVDKEVAKIDSPMNTELEAGVEISEKERLKQVEEALGDKAKDSIAALPNLRKKATTAENAPVSLIQSAPGGEALPTPPDEFSKSLDLDKSPGKYLYPQSASDDLKRRYWTPLPNATHFEEGALDLELTNFDSTKLDVSYNTLAIKFMAPSESSRFSINIAGPGHREYYDVLFHFNPRQFQKGGQLIVNDKQDGTWGNAVTAPLSSLPLIFGQLSCTLMIQVTEEGFDVFVEGEHCSRLEHRTQLPPSLCSLFLQCPSTDDYGSPEDWRVYSVWWGHREPMAGSDLSGVVGVNSHTFGGVHAKKLFVSGLTKLSDSASIELRRAELERAFRKYGGTHGAIVDARANSTYAFVELESERMTDLALTELQSTYRMNRARRSKQEIIQEQLQAQEETKAQESSGWD